MSDSKDSAEIAGLSRREVLAASGLGLAALSMTVGAAAPAAAASPRTAPKPPFDSLRDWVAALEAHNLVLHVDRIDQDAYEATGLVFRATDRFGMFNVPAMRFDNLKIDGRWTKGPVFGLLQANQLTDAILFGQEVDVENPRRSYRLAKAYLADILNRNGAYPEIPPVEIARDKAPCKQVVLRGDDIDITKFAFVKTNPSDGGRYVNTCSHFMWDPEIGPNFGTYRCQIRGPRVLGFNPEPNQTGWRMLQAAKKRGEKSVKVSSVMGQDPVTWFISGTKVANRFTAKGPIDELALAGGFRGKPVEVVKSETNDLLIPAHAEMVIEGEIPLDQPGLDEGPFGEMFGYLGPLKPENYWMNITAITHRRDPWLINAFTGMQRGMVTSPQDTLYDYNLRKALPFFVEMAQPQDVMGLAVMSIDKTKPGQGLEAGRLVAQRNPIAKVIVVVDKDVDVLDRDQTLFAIGSRWQPYPASEVVKDIMGIVTDPSQKVQGRTSKMIIDATRQLPEEGGRDKFPETNRALLQQGAPQVFDEVDRLYGGKLRDWRPV